MKRWKKLLLYSVSLTGILLASLIIVRACGGELDPYDYYTTFFHPDVQGKKDYGAFYFTDYQFTYDDSEPSSEADLNSAEWAAYLGAPVKVKDVEKAMYGLDNAGKKNLARSLDQDLSPADSLTNNSFLITLKQAGHETALQYFRYALEIEPLASTTFDQWNPAPLDTAELSAAAAKALAAAGHMNDNFIKLRYYYQAQRLLHYGKNYEQARQIYIQHIAATPSEATSKAGRCHARPARTAGWAIPRRQLINSLKSSQIIPNAGFKLTETITIYVRRSMMS